MEIGAVGRSSNEFNDETSATESSSIVARQAPRSCTPLMVLATMHSGMACRAERDQVFLGIRPRMAAKLPMMHFEVRHGTTRLTPPVVASQDLPAQSLIRAGIHSHARGYRASHDQEARSPMLSRKACCCSPDRNWKKRVIE